MSSLSRAAVVWLLVGIWTGGEKIAAEESGPSTAAPAESAGGETSGEDSPGDEPAAADAKNDATEMSADEYRKTVTYPLVILVVGIAIVLGLIIILKINAFIALIAAAMAVSLMAVGLLGQGGWADAIGRVASAFGSTAGGIGLVIAMAAVIGTCMLDSGAADRIVRAFMKVLGVKGSPVALMGSGFVLAVPVFFDTVFYLLVPLARSLHRKTTKNYLMYIMAIAAGGAITHTLVPPTPGPMMMAENLSFDIGVMIIVGAIIALPAAFAGLVFAVIADKIMNVPMRPIPGQTEPDPLADEDLPGLFVSLSPILLPVLLIAANTVMTTIADGQHAARLQVDDIQDWSGWRQELRTQLADDRETPAGHIVETLRDTKKPDPESRVRIAVLLESETPLSDDEKAELTQGLNQYIIADKYFHRGDAERAFLGVFPNPTARGLLNESRLRMKAADVERMNRALLESAYPDFIAEHQWETPVRKAANVTALFGNPNFALLISTVIALWMVVKKRGLTKKEMAALVENSLMSGGVIILITAGGGAFGKMLEVAQIGEAVKVLFGGYLKGAEAGIMILVLSFLLGAVLKVAQGSGTVAMIVGTSMMAAIVGSLVLQYHPVYIATAVGAGSLVGSWMNDSGFWIFAKMGGLTEGEALKSWTLLLVVLGLVSFATTLLLSQVLRNPLTIIGSA